MLTIALCGVLLLSFLIAREVNKRTRVNVSRRRIPRLATIESYNLSTPQAELKITFPGLKGEDSYACLEVQRDRRGDFPDLKDEVWVYINPFKPDDISLHYAQVSNMGDVVVAFLFSSGIGLTIIMSYLLMWG